VTSLESFIARLDFSGWPLGGNAFWPSAVKWTIVAGSLVAIWIFAAIVRRMIVWFGKAALKKEETFDGSGWDFAASIARFATILVFMPLPLTLAGADWEKALSARAPGLIAAGAILFGAFLLANWAARAIRSFGRKAHRRTGADDTLFAFAASFLKYGVFAVALLLALTQLGFPSTSLAALLGASALAIGLALQDTLKAVAAGIMLAIFRPFRIGDYVAVGGLEGLVHDITPFTTSLRQTDNKIVSLTNDKVWSEPLINHTRQEERYLDLRIDLAYEDDIDRGLAVLKETAEQHSGVRHKDQIWVGVQALGESGVTLRLRAWCASEFFLQVRSDLLKQMKQAFDREGLSIPYPHQVQVSHRSAKARPDESP
jgi:small-conductance mechanosensitive channel